MKRLAALCIAVLLPFTVNLHAADDSATTLLSHMADCIREAGDMKGAQRDAFMKTCTSAKPATTATDAGPSAAAAVVPPPIAPAAVTVPAVAAAPGAGDLPPQEQILACATATQGMQGEERSKVLKDCLAGKNEGAQSTAAVTPRETACAAQAKSQPVAEREAFLAACLTGKPANSPTEARRLAACNVEAEDQSGAARKAFIEKCMASMSSAPNAAQSGAVAH